MLTLLVLQPDGSVKKFDESESHISLNRQKKKRNIDFEIYIRKIQSSTSSSYNPINTETTPYHNIPQIPSLANMQGSSYQNVAPQNPLPPTLENTSNVSIPLTQNSYPPNIRTDSKPENQPSKKELRTPKDPLKIDSEIFNPFSSDDESISCLEFDF